MCRGGQEYKRTVPISGPINPFGLIRISPLIARFPCRPPPTTMTFVSLRLMDNYQRPRRSSITIPETLGPLIGDFVFPRASVENCFRRPVCVLFREKRGYFSPQFHLSHAFNRFVHFLHNFEINVIFNNTKK